MAFDGEVDQAVDECRVGQARLLPEPWIHRDGREARDRVDRSAADLNAALLEVLDGEATDWERVEALVRSVFRVALEQPLLMGLLREVSRPGSPAAPRLKGAMGPLMDRAQAWMEREMDAGRMRRTDAQLVLISAYSTVVGLATEIEVLRAAGLEPTMRTVATRRRELLRFLRASLDPQR